MRHLQYLII